LGLELIDGDNVSQRSEGLAQLMLDVTRRFAEPLTLERLLEWHQWLFPDQEADLTARRMHVGALRGDEPMQVVSGRIDRPTVHFEAPPRQGLEQQLDQFLQWFEASQHQTALDPMLRAGIAHFWFVTLHPFDDGNGRLTRTITDLALAQGEAQAIRFYAMSASILDDRSGYYRILESSQKATLDITEWLTWFLQTLLRSLQQAITRIESVLGKSRFWQAHRESELSAEQIKVLNRLLDGSERGFEHGISAGQYQAVAKVSKATATRHLAELLDKGCLQRLPGGGRSTRYQINYPDRAKH
jgi:Fic family protein